MEIKYLQKVVAYGDTSSFHIGYLPPNAYITDIKCLVTTSFEGGVLDVGDDTTANKYANDIDVDGTGSKTVTSTAFWGAVNSTADQTEIKGIIVAASTGLSQGAAKVVVEYAFNE